MYFAAAVLVFVVLMILFFRPLPLSGVIKANDRILIALQELGVENGKPYIRYTNDQEMTAGQKDAVLALLGEYSYQRSLGTLFPAAVSSDAGDKILFLYGYEGASLAESIVVSSSGSVIVNDQCYRMKNAEQFMNSIVAVVR